MPADIVAIADAAWVRTARVRLGPEHALLQLGRWERLVPLCASRTPPRVLVVSSSAIDQNASRILDALENRGMRPDSLLFMDDTTPDSMGRAWPLARPSAHLIFDWTELIRELERLRTSEGRIAVVMFIKQRLAVRSELVCQILSTIAKAGPQHVSVDDVATEVGKTRSTVYAALARAGLPGIEQIQILLRLVQSMDIVRTGGRSMDAAFVAGYGSAGAWRQALRDRLDASVDDVRENSGWQWAVERWLGRNERTDAIRRAGKCATHRAG